MKQNILVLVDHFGQGGAEKVATMLAQTLHESGRYKVWLYAIHQPAAAAPILNLPTGSLGIRSGGGTINKLRNYYRKISRLKKLKKELKIALSISSLWPVDWINVLAGKDKKIAIIQINILNNEQNVMMVRFRKLVTAVYKKFDRVVLGSANLLPELTGFFQLPAERLEVIHNSIDTKLIERNLQAPLPAKLQGVFNRYQVLTAANRLHPIKNTEALVPIYQKIKNENTRLLIIGEGEQKETLISRLREGGLTYSQTEAGDFREEADVYLMPFQSNIHHLIGRSKLFLFPTKGEGLPLALLEAMYCGVPVLVSDCPNGGVFEAMEGEGSYDPGKERAAPAFTGGGWLMPIPLSSRPETIDAWAHTIRQSLAADDAELQRIRTHNRNRAAAFDKDSIRTHWFRLIDEVLNQP